MKKEQMPIIREKLVESKKLEVLGLNEMPFDIKEIKDIILEIMKANAETLRHLAMNRAPLTT